MNFATELLRNRNVTFIVGPASRLSKSEIDDVKKLSDISLAVDHPNRTASERTTFVGRTIVEALTADYSKRPGSLQTSFSRTFVVRAIKDSELIGQAMAATRVTNDQSGLRGRFERWRTLQSASDGAARRRQLWFSSISLGPAARYMYGETERGLSVAAVMLGLAADHAVGYEAVTVNPQTEELSMQTELTGLGLRPDDAYGIEGVQPRQLFGKDSDPAYEQKWYGVTAAELGMGVAAMGGFQSMAQLSSTLDVKTNQLRLGLMPLDNPDSTPHTIV